MEYIAEITIRTQRRLTREAFFAVAELGGSAAGTPGRRMLNTGLYVKADDAAATAASVIDTVITIAPGDVVAAEIMTPEEQDRRLAEPAFPPLVGVTEVAGLLGISRQRLAVLRNRDDFPAPIAELAAGPVWREGDLSRFADGCQRRPGRPRKTVVNQR